MSDGIVAIESRQYGEEQDRLTADPIIQGMARGVPAGVDMTKWEFIHAACRYYGDARREAGTDAGEFGSIGGPARAICAIKVADGTATPEGVAL